MIYLSPNLEPLEDFMDLIEKWIPKGKRVTRIYEIHPHPEKLAQVYAQITAQNNRTYTIGLYRRYYRLNSLKSTKRTLKTYSTLDTLAHLAHELSHLYEWKHTPNRQIKECEILIDFMNRASELGYKSEEVELKHKYPDTRKTYSIYK